MLPDPFGQAGRRLAWVDLDLGPVGFLEELGVGEADFLGAGGAGESIGCQCQVFGAALSVSDRR